MNRDLPVCGVCMTEISDDFYYQADHHAISFPVCKDCLKTEWLNFVCDLEDYMSAMEETNALGHEFNKFVSKVLDGLNKPDRCSSKLERFMADYEVDNEEVLERWLTFR